MGTAAEIAARKYSKGSVSRNSVFFSTSLNDEQHDFIAEKLCEAYGVPRESMVREGGSYNIMRGQTVLALVGYRMMTFEDQDPAARKAFEASLGLIGEAGPVGAEPQPA
jgi:hypothetical protein